ncbi:hypothetical protein TNCV_2210341 [Trichonephila clavipes]|nr:hypothetical protein TNCV_2210341 [Trichonephila clavipes]
MFGLDLFPPTDQSSLLIVFLGRSQPVLLTATCHSEVFLSYLNYNFVSSKILSNTRQTTPPFKIVDHSATCKDILMVVITNKKGRFLFPLQVQSGNASFLRLFKSPCLLVYEFHCVGVR